MAASVQDLFYDALVSSYVDSGVYLEWNWLEQRLDTRLVQAQAPFILIIGRPAAGKTSFVAGLARKNEHWLIWV